MKFLCCSWIVIDSYYWSHLITSLWPKKQLWLSQPSNKYANLKIINISLCKQYWILLLFSPPDWTRTSMLSVSSVVLLITSSLRHLTLRKMASLKLITGKRFITVWNKMDKSGDCKARERIRFCSSLFLNVIAVGFDHHWLDKFFPRLCCQIWLICIIRLESTSASWPSAIDLVVQPFYS